MAGIVGLTELQHTNGNSMLTVATTGDGNVKSEGGAATTSLRQGLCKAWINFEGDGTIATSDSFNVTSIADRGTGQYTITIASDMGNANYSVSGSGTHDAGSYIGITAIAHDVGLATGTCPVDSFPSDAGNPIDTELICVTIHGDLA